MFHLWANTAESDVPAHSNKPLSRDTPNVISVGTVGTLMAFKKAMKLAVHN